jgi:DNA-directed RNA polymerase subunit K/omega
MSDAEEYEEEGEVEYEEAGSEEADIADIQAKVEEELSDEELGLVEDAAGSIDEEDSAEMPEADVAPERGAPGKGGSASGPARPEKPKVDPLLRASNRPRVTLIVADDERRTDNRLQKTEAAAVLARRAKQIATYGKRFVDSGSLHDPVQIALKELYERRCPLKLRREVGYGPAGELLVEEWRVREMTLPPLSSLGLGSSF